MRSNLQPLTLWLNPNANGSNRTIRFHPKRSDHPGSGTALDGSAHMSDRPKKSCRHPNCPELVTPPTTYCDAHQPAPRIDNRPSSDARGYDHKWRKFKDAYLRANPLCVDCLTDKRPEPATEVHHKVKLSVAPERKYDKTNLMSLCRKCHQIRTNRGE